MIKLSKTQYPILKAAVSRPGGTILPLPDGINLKGGALKVTLASLVKRGLVAERGKKPVITKAGRDTIRTSSQGNTTERHSIDGRATTNNGTRAETKQARILTALRRPQGAGIAELMEITGWQSHSVRAALTGLRKREIPVTRAKDENGASIYRAGPA